jgi:hypothetical protein
MTTAEVIDHDRQARPDWVVVARIIWGQPVGCEPTESEMRAAVWLMYDQGYGQGEIIAHTGASKKFVERVAHYRRMVARPSRRRSGQRPAKTNYRALAPSRQLRHILAGVRSYAQVAPSVPMRVVTHTGEWRP